MTLNELPTHQRLALLFLRFLARIGGHYAIDFDVELMHQHGIVGMVVKGLRMQRQFNQLRDHFGLEEAHVLAAFASFFNGCEYCAWGHIFAVNLRYFRRTQQLFPLDERDVPKLMSQTDTQALDAVEAIFGAEHAKLTALVRRQFALRSEAGTDSKDDQLLRQSLTLFQWVNECSIITPAPAPPLDFTALDKPLLAAYAKARGR